jgi:hypothetical protein
VEEYWHIGETQARLRNVVPRSVNGLKRVLMVTANLIGRATLPRYGRDPCRSSVVVPSPPS